MFRRVMIRFFSSVEIKKKDKEEINKKLYPNGKFSKWFVPRSISSFSSVIVRVSVVLKRTVGDSD